MVKKKRYEKFEKKKQREPVQRTNISLLVLPQKRGQKIIGRLIVEHKQKYAF